MVVSLKDEIYRIMEEKMVLGAITIGAIGVAYFTGNTVRKQKMRQIGSQVADVTKDVAGDVLNQTKHLIYKIQKNRAKKNTQKWK